MNKVIFSLIALFFTASSAYAQTCAELPKYEELKKALTDARKQNNGGLNLDMWGTITDRSGIVCAVAYTGTAVDSQWPGSRVISAQKANTANAFSLAGMSLSTANLYSATQPGGFLFGLQESNPVDVKVAYEGAAPTFGSAKDPMVGKRIGGVNVFGGGLALYSAKGVLLGAIGTSGDTSCADHNVTWHARHNLKLDFVPGGVAADKSDNAVYDIGTNGKSKGGFGHPKCVGKEVDMSKKLPAISKVG